VSDEVELAIDEFRSTGRNINRVFASMQEFIHQAMRRRLLHQLPRTVQTDEELAIRYVDEERAMLAFGERPEADVWAERAAATRAEIDRR
jgi:hypothetical protein